MIRTLIEQWLPTGVIGAESLRERGASSALPPVNFLHVWWARRPLTVSRAAVVASMLPAWPDENDISRDPLALSVREELQHRFGTISEYHSWFVETMGILGDPVAGRERIAAARLTGERLTDGGYGYKRAFTVSPPPELRKRIRELAALVSGHDGRHTVLDAFAGGGSIPFESRRFGFDSVAAELNPVAVAILTGTVDLPFSPGERLVPSLRRWGERWRSKVVGLLRGFYPQRDDERIVGYIWAHSVPCPATGRPTPLCPDLWLARESGRSIAVRLLPSQESGRVTTSVVEGDAALRIGPHGTYKRGVGRSVWAEETFSGEYIRSQALAGNITTTLLAICATPRGKTGRHFRAPGDDDIAAIGAAESYLAAHEARWAAADLIPTESIGAGKETKRSLDMGLFRWRDMFTHRQLAAGVTYLETMHEVMAEVREAEDRLTADAVAVYLALVLDKCIDYNSMLSSWDATRIKVRNTFDRHDFAYKWTFAEFDAASALLPWALDQVIDAYAGMARLCSGGDGLLADRDDTALTIRLGSATSIDRPGGSVDAVVVDPPYYDNVIYSECSDYFYVWLKRALRDTMPEICGLLLTDKDGEAVANPSRFADVATALRGRRGTSRMGKTANELADEDYEAKLTVAFREAHRVLTEQGVLTVMFTHKRVDAWDTLGAALLAAGFTIESSWPVHTESEHSLHQARKNAASSTILLTCRKRQSTEPGWWEDIRQEVGSVARAAAARFSADGMRGVDLTLSTFGPALSVLSRHWPVYSGAVDPATGESIVLRPDVALDLARAEVGRLKKRGLLGGRDVRFDPVTDFYLLAWSDFRAAQFPSGEALKLAIATGLELDDLLKRYRVLGTAAGFVELLTPAQRRAAGVIKEGEMLTGTLLDVAHLLMLAYDEEGEKAAAALLRGSGLEGDERIGALIEALITAIPRTRSRDGAFDRPEARALEGLRLTIFPSVNVPAEVEAVSTQITLALDGDAGDGEDGDA